MTLFRHVKTKYGAVPVHDIIKMRDQASPTYIKFELHRNVSSHTIPTGRYRSNTNTCISTSNRHHCGYRKQLNLTLVVIEYHHT
jgi:hypothetical protein